MAFDSASSASTLAADGRSLNALKLASTTASANPATIKETAKQFESMFMRELLKSMRDATMKSGMLDNAGGDMATDLLDQQLSVKMSGQPGGLSDLIIKQLTHQVDAAKNAAAANSAASADSSNANTSSSSASGSSSKVSSSTPSTSSKAALSAAASAPLRHAPTQGQTSFVQRHAQVARAVEQATGIPASFMLGQAGHETGWGQHEIKLKGGASSFNLFGIKAGSDWGGKVAEVTTTEYIGGTPQKRVARFRAYDSYADAFKDYARMISQSPRYSKAMAQTGNAQAFASGLQKAGYATDPDYAAKLSRAINTTLAIQRAQA